MSKEHRRPQCFIYKSVNLILSEMRVTQADNIGKTEGAFEPVLPFGIE